MAAISLALLPGIAAQGYVSHTFYLPSDDTAPMDEEASGTMLPGQGLEVESAGGAPYARATVALAHTLTVPVEGAFHLHLEDREPLAPGPQELTTRVEITLQDAQGETLRDENGEPALLASGTWTFSHPGVRNVEAEGWTDFHLDARPVGGIGMGGFLDIPAGYRVVLTFDLVPENDALTLGAQGGALLEALADAFDPNVPDQGEAPLDGPIVRNFNASEMTTGEVRRFARGNGQNVDALTNAFVAAPRSTFEADDRGSWLAVRAYA